MFVNVLLTSLGICDPSFGTCSCLQGFTGTACERLDCENSCGGNGRCFSMHDYANKFRNSNSRSFTYNSVWDAPKITGCVCDPGFFDYQVTSHFAYLYICLLTEFYISCQVCGTKLSCW